MSKPDLLTNVITVRGQSFTVSEIDGRTMADVRKLLDGPEKGTLEAFLTCRCCVEPKFANMTEAAAAPHAVSKAISEEAFRLTNGDGQEKNG